MPSLGAREVDEVDVALIDALHVNPRASFAKLGATLELSPVTAARRWHRLVDEGLAWVSSVPGPRLALVGAVYEAEACPGRSGPVARALSAVPQVASVYLTDGTLGLHSLVLAADMDALGELLLDRLPAIDGTARARAHVGIEWFSEVRWRLGAISVHQARSLAGGVAGDGDRDARTLVLPDEDRALFLALQRDGRAGYRDLARELGTSEDAVRRQLASLLRRGALSFRADFARASGGWPAELVLWLAVPPEQLEMVGADLGKWPQTRICLSVVGEANLLLMAQVHRLGDIAGLLKRVRAAFPEVTVRDQRIVLRPVKSWGRLLDHGGSAADVIPVDPWAPLSFAPSG